MSTIEENHQAILAAPAPEQRYKAVLGSGHACCNDASVVDTTKPFMIGGKHYEGKFEEICETHDLATAQMIADALNAAEPI